MVQHYPPAVSFGPVGISVQDDGTLLLVKDNTSELPESRIEAAMARAEHSALQMGFVRESIAPNEENMMFSAWVLVKAEKWAS